MELEDGESRKPPPPLLQNPPPFPGSCPQTLAPRNPVVSLTHPPFTGPGLGINLYPMVGKKVTSSCPPGPRLILTPTGPRTLHNGFRFLLFFVAFLLKKKTPRPHPAAPPWAISMPIVIPTPIHPTAPLPLLGQG